MERERADRSVSFYVTNEGPTRCGLPRASSPLEFLGATLSPVEGSRGFSPIFITATISIVALLAVAGWQIDTSIRARSAATSYVATPERQDESPSDTLTSSLPVPGPQTNSIGSAVLDSVVAKYLSLKDQGLYTPEVGAKTAEKIAATLNVPISFHQFTASDISTDADTSYTRMLAYRHDMQVSSAALLRNTQPEYEIFAYYVSTKDKSYLQKLQKAAQNYRAAASSTARVTVPKDALSQHLGILNAMEEFAAALDALAANADDPLASAVLLRTYNQAETDVLASFQALAKYYRQKPV